MGLAAALVVIGIILGYPKVSVTETETDAETSATLWMHPSAIVVPGDNPLWFEFSDEEPLVISSPEEASLRSFVPWPHSIHIQNMLIDENRLVMAVNRLGFLVFIPWDNNRLGMYSVSDKNDWSPHSIASFFLFDQKPSALLYRNDFFSNNEDISLPETPVRALIKGNTQPITAEIPAFKDFPSLNGWDIEALDQGKDGAWYFIVVQKSSDIYGKFYYKAESLDEQPSPISMGDYWLALEPESVRNAPLLLRETSEKAIGSRSENHSYLIEKLSLNSEYETHYSSHSGEGDIVSLFVFSDDNTALAVFSDGSGAAGKKNADDSIETFLYALPELPADFFYTGIALADDTIMASWEEQRSYGVGAAGFVLVKYPF